MGLGQWGRLASVRCLTLPSRRKDSRRRIHGGELRLATVSIYMAIKRAQIDIKSKIKIHLYMATYLCQKTRESSIEAIQRTIAQSKFRLGTNEQTKQDPRRQHRQHLFGRRRPWKRSSAPIDARN